MFPHYTDANSAHLREEWATLAEAGDRCAVLTTANSTPSVDFAIVVLERPVPHPVVDPSTVGAGAAFVEPIAVAADVPARGATFEAVAVGFGRTAGASGGGVRRFRHLTLTMGIDTVARSGVLAGGDSGGPLLVETAGVYQVVGVASNEFDWGVLRREARDWIRSKIDPDADGSPSVFCVGDSSRESDPAVDASNDADGDWVPNAIDTCPDTYNPCQQRGDVDADGVPDDCDACPTNAGVRDLRGTLPDGDLDGVPDTCDCAPDIADIGDADHDTLRDRCDNCPHDPNPFQEDDDADGLGDACDRCPLHAGDAGDEDRDNVPNACDNCDIDPNPGQANCNADAEAMLGLFEPDVFNGALGVGDACDPIPCGETRVGVRSTLEVRDGRDARVYRPRVLVDALAAPVRSARAGFRFCRCALGLHDNMATRRVCLDPVGEVPDITGGCLIADNDAYSAVSPEAPPWLRISLVEDATVEGPVDLGYEAGLSYALPEAGFVADLERDWLLQDDIFRWTLRFGGTVPTPTPGVLWTRTPGPAGGGNFPAGSPEYDLAHHYYSGRVEPEAVTFAPEPNPCFGFVGPFLFDASFCPVCAGAFPAPWIGAGLALPRCPPALGLPEIMLADGLLEAAPSFATDPAPVFHVAGAWVAASEPEGWLPDEGLRYVAVRGDGAIERLLVQTALGIADADEPPFEPCPNCVEPLTARVRSVEPPPMAVLSARRSIVWVFRGQSLLVHELGRELSHVANDPAVPLGRTLAATYDPANDRVVVLDEVFERRGSARRPVVRLLALHPITGDVEVVARIPRAHRATRFALAPDGNGGLWVASSSDAGGHVTVLLSSWRSVEVAGWSFGRGTLASGQARADGRGLSLAVVARGESAVVGHAVADLLPGSVGALHRCF